MAGCLTPGIAPSGPRSKPRPVVSDSQFATVKLSSLRAGATLKNPIMDERNVLLLAAGARLTPSVLQILAHRGLQYVKVHRSELSECTGGGTGATADLISACYERAMNAGRKLQQSSQDREQQESRISREEPKRTSEVQQAVKQHGDERYDADKAKEFFESFDQSKTQIDAMFNGLEEIGRTEMEQFSGITEASLRQMTSDMDLYLAMGVSAESDLYPARHSLQTSMLALAVGSRCGLAKRELLQLGIGCLAHDVGMMDVDKQLIESTSPLDPLRFLEITKHPTITFDKMRSVQQAAGASRLVAYQMHERLNGTGYPRQRRTGQIHPLSKIASVADVFVALISPRPHRSGMVPYYAIEHLLRSTKKGEFDSRVVRAFLETVSLFPIGSYIELSDGRVGKVIRTNGTAFAQPTIEVWNRACLEADPEVVNLTKRNDLSIVRPLRSLERSGANEIADSWE